MAGQASRGGVIPVHITALAERDLEGIWLTIAANNPRAATKLLRTIGRKIDLLADFSRLRARRRDVRPGMRIMVARPYLLLYAIHPDSDEARRRRRRRSRSRGLSMVAGTCGGCSDNPVVPDPAS